MKVHMTRAAIFALVLVFAGTQSAHAKIYQQVDENGRIQYSDKPFPSKSRAAGSGSSGTSKPKLQQSIDERLLKYQKPSIIKKVEINTSSRFSGLPDSIVLKLRSLLEQRKFKELNRVLELFRRQVETDIVQEEKLFTAYSAFDIASPEYETIISEWIQLYPGSYQPYLARSTLYVAMGWHARGNKWANKTKKNQFTIMRRFFAKARSDIEQTLSIDLELLPAYGLLIQMAKADKKNSKEFSYFSDAIRISPATYEVRRILLWGLTPRWGGSFDKMKSVIKDAQSYLPMNPRLAKLQGAVFEEIGKIKTGKKAYGPAIEALTQSIELSETPGAYSKRGLAHSFQQQYELALADHSRAIELYSEDHLSYYRRSYVHYKLKNYQAAKLDIEKADALNPGSEKIEKRAKYISSLFVQQGYNYYKEKNPAAALQAYNHAIELSPSIAKPYSRRARALIALGKFDAAEADTKKAIELDPNYYHFYELLDWILVHNQDWDQIITYWDQFIELNPDNAKAYNERGGAKYHKGDLAGAIEDAKNAADRGNREGKLAYEKLKHLAN